MCDSQKRFWRRLEVYTPHSRGGSQGELPECKLVFGAICGDRKGYDDSLFCNYMQATKSDLITIIATPGIGQFNVRLLMVEASRPHDRAFQLEVGNHVQMYMAPARNYVKTFGSPLNINRALKCTIKAF